ncbi:MAG: hypothetical protein COA49_06875 [Bacteroidetes bacterium]|nr:MAG: hypothetical protein COA49_06875 [Bacteroidota bacterium]
MLMCIEVPCGKFGAMQAERKIKFISVAIYFIVVLTGNDFLAQTNTGITTGKDAVYGEEGVDVLFSHTSGVHISVHTQGAGVGGRYGYFKTAKKSKSIAVDLRYFKHEKEEKTVNPVYNDGLPYIFGKVNSFLAFNIVVETRKQLTPKLRKGAVQVSTVKKYGVSLGIEKPVYLEIGYPEIPYEYLATERYNPEEHFYNDIYGRSPWVNGLDEIKLIPGGSISYGLLFEYSDKRSKTKSVELGMTLDVFMRPIEIMAVEFVDSKMVFLNLYLRLEVGAKWTQAR